MFVASWCCKSFCVVPCDSFCTGHFVMVPLNMTYLHCLQHSLFEHLFNLYTESQNGILRVLLFGIILSTIHECRFRNWIVVRFITLRCAQCWMWRQQHLFVYHRQWKQRRLSAVYVTSSYVYISMLQHNFNVGIQTWPFLSIIETIITICVFIFDKIL